MKWITFLGAIPTLKPASCSEQVLGPLVAALLLFTLSAQGGALITLTSPTDFFTNVATRLLRSELNLNFNQIQIYPTNQYAPSVHRLLQVTANLYDCTTNRVFGSATNYPYCPSVFRPIFRRMGSTTNGIVVIAGYREIRGTDLVQSRLAPIMVALDQPNPPLAQIPPYGLAFSAVEKDEPMVSGVPLIIAARRGLPNFNELAVQTAVYVSRLLEFRRPGLKAPVSQTNQMYVIGISNNFGLEAWNSYVTNYPRDLNLVASLNITAILTNQAGAANVVFSNSVVFTAMASIPSNSWSGWSSVSSAPNSMVLPFGSTNSFVLLTNSTALDQFPWLEPLTHVFPNVTQGAFYVSHWWLNLNMRVLFALVDTTANRIVDYVNLTRWEPTVDITTNLVLGFNPLDPFDYNNPANEWITNRLDENNSTEAPTYGVLNQIAVGLNGVNTPQAYSLDSSAGLDAQSAVDGFRYNLLSLSPIYPKDQGKVFYKSNVFYAPFDPYRTIFIHTSWQANDPLVHYTTYDLLDFGLNETNRVDLLSHVPPLDNLGKINNRYRPWGGNPLSAQPFTDYQISLKDPWVTRPDDWDFPTNEPLGVNWVGRVHRGTPWQTIFLKSTNILQSAPGNSSLITWQLWTGNPFYLLNWGKRNVFIPDARLTSPTNDWHLVSRLSNFFSPNDPHQLASPNQIGIDAWKALLDGMTVLTNVSQSELQALTISSNSPQAAIIAQAILNTRASVPGLLFQNVGDILATPALSEASPWLSPVNTSLVTDEALEIIPSQLLSLLRPDSIGAPISAQDSAQFQFSGLDGYPYAVQVSTNLLDWTTVTTNTPMDGVIDFPMPSPSPAQFYRSKLLP